MGIGGGQSTKGAVNIGDIVDVSGRPPTKRRCKYRGHSGCGGQPTKGAVNIVDIADGCE